ncbi:MAG: tRNA (adenosine(37)-N6)-threonylcarbamoyltransferase complex transferase subunit TsaD [Gemmatales bacterium]
MLFLSIETSCDETAAAVFEAGTPESGPVIRSSVVASQLKLHARFGGVVPEVAARAHLQQVLPVIDNALREAGITLQQINAIAVMNRPGLVGALLVGVSAAKALSWSLGIPLLAVNHIDAHLYACRLAAQRDIYPCIGLVVSGGHTTVFHCQDALHTQPLGGTIDDAAGEAFDKVAALLGLGFPGGPAVERAANAGNPKAFTFPRSFFHEDRLDFSFSGLKTAVRYCLRDLENARTLLSEQVKADVAASFQQAVVDVLVEKCRQALTKMKLRTLAVGGGVTANQAFRTALQTMAEQAKVEVIIPPMAWCTDNAAMAALAVESWRAVEIAGLDIDAEPVWSGRKVKRKG